MSDKSSGGGSLALAIWNGPGVVIAREGLTTEAMRDELVRQARAHGAQIVDVDALLSDEAIAAAVRGSGGPDGDVPRAIMRDVLQAVADALTGEAPHA